MPSYLEVTLRRVRLERGGRTVLEGIDWTVSPGQRWVLVGPNGSGKTQLLKLLAASVWPTPAPGTLRRYRSRGTLALSAREVKEEIAYVGAERQDKYERYGWDFSVAAVVGTGIHRTDIPLDPLGRDDLAAIESLLASFRLSHLRERRFLALSYGERRLVLLARALAARPRLLLLDELLNGLDEANHAAALGWLARTRRTRLPWVLATHRAEDVPESATHALVLARGRIAYRGALERAPLARWLAGTARALRPSAHAPQAARGVAAAHPRRLPLVRLTDASVFIDGHRVLEDLSLEIRSGQCWVVHGPNGSGKTTLLRTIFGDHTVASGGSIERAGIARGVPLDEFKRTVGLVAPHLQAAFLATPSLLARPRRGARAGEPQPGDFTVTEAVLSGRHASIGLAAAPDLPARRAARRALAAFGLEGLGARALSELSYGQLRRVLFARAWVSEPALVLLDEPFTGIDTPTRHALALRLARQIAQGVALVIATHRRHEWPGGVTHELELCAGRSRYCGPLRARRRVANIA
ncbi:MAG TPA: ATP-binding cassette domain-containing protein [Steroidobacteraceae bacterium]|nr:ATP-binding cassette domain-containing protein [Steroidobacteraceae bacterium]